MTELWAILAPILLADVFNVVLFAFLVYAAGTARPVLNSSLALLGHTLAYFAAGIGVALGLEQVADRLANPKTIDFAIELLVGLLLLWAALPIRKASRNANPPKPAVLTPVKAFGLGALMNFVGIPFALPYFAAVDQILKADLSTASALFVLAVYNVAYAVPFAVVPLLRMIMGDRSRPILERVNGWINNVSTVLMPVLLGLIGLALLVDSVYYFVAGRMLF